MIAACAALTAQAAATAGGGGDPRRSPAAGPRSNATTLWAVGDADAGARARRLAARVRGERPDLFLYLGDVYETGTASEFRTRYDPLYGPLARRTIPTPGNHEWASRETGYRPYWRSKLGRTLPDWHRRRVANGWEILSLSSEAPRGPGSRQIAWLRQAVRRPGTCRIAIWHRPRWSSGRHGDQADIAPLWNALRGHARVVLSGHDHDLQRFADRDGLRQVISGGGGRPNVPIPRPSRATVRYANRLTTGGARLRLTRGHARIDLVASSGRVLDRSDVRCRPL